MILAHRTALKRVLTPFAPSHLLPQASFAPRRKRYSRGMAGLPKIAITMGDPSGVGPEICLKLLQLPELTDVCVPIILGNAAILNRTAIEMNSPEINRRLAGLNRIQMPLDSVGQARESDKSSGKTQRLNQSPVKSNARQFFGKTKSNQPESIERWVPNLKAQPTLVDFVDDRISEVQTGRVSGLAGNAAYQYIETAIEWSLNGSVDAVTTGPINKLALHAAGHDFPGHTEIFAIKTRTSSYCMMQYSAELTCAFVTTHVGYSEVTRLLTIERILEVILLSTAAIRKLEDRDPVIVVCGLNPHAGESGLFGNREEEQFIAPAIALARQQGVNVSGPFPPDTCFVPARRKSTDCFICMYHDQGHIPLKALVFDQAVNMTLGLPIIRTSVDHGTAFDIAGKNLADPSSLIQAVMLAAKLASANLGDRQLKKYL